MYNENLCRLLDMKIILFLLLSVSCFGQDIPLSWKLSVGTMIAAQSADAYTTLQPHPGFHEVNPLGPRGVVIEKVATTGSLVLIEYLLVRHHKNRAKWFTLLNAGLSSEFAWAAWHNERLKH